MQTWLSQLSEQLRNLNHRQIIWLAGDHHWAWQIINPWLAQFQSNIYVGQAELKHAYLTCVKASKPSTLLGYDCDNVVFDAHHGLFPDALTAIAGTIKPGGFLFLMTPDLTSYPYFSDEFAKARTSFGMESKCNNEHTIRRLIDLAKTHGAYIFEQANSQNLPSLPTNEHSNADQVDPTAAQHELKKQIISHLNQSDSPQIHVITADRGRGKSHLLGLITNDLINSNEDNGIKYYLCAPNRAATQSVFKALTSANKQRIQFVAPELLLASASPSDTIIIDEAASMPIPMLIKWSETFQNLILASTTHGYEGTGKGFQIRFFKHLDTLTDQGKIKWHQYTLTHPIRYGDNDPVENFLFDAFCLDSELNTVNLNEKTTFKFKNVHIPQNELCANPDLLKQIFGLLVQAHYQTKPSDLRDLLDAPGLNLFAQYFKHKGKQIISCVCLTNDEGPIAHYDSQSNDLHTDILQGYRRPKGHLIPQVLGFHLGLEQAFNLRGARIVRIATQPELQQKGLGKELLKFVVQHFKNLNYDYLGSSFASTDDVENFWKKQAFKTIRQGNKLDKASGTQSALVLYGLSQKGLKLEEQAVHFFEHQDQKVTSFDELKPLEQQILIRFMDHNGSYESVKTILNRFEHFTLELPKKPSKEFKQAVFDFLFEKPAQT